MDLFIMLAQTFLQNLSIAPIKAFTDNYIWCLHNQDYAVVVDPGDSEPVLTFCRENQLSLVAILITHHHPDHTGGIEQLCKDNNALPVIGPRGGHIKGITKPVAQGDAVKLPLIDCEFNVIEIPGHTLDHIGYYGHGALFCGDTLFSAGCGRLFEGTAEQMHRSLQKIKHFPVATQLYCTHEYTEANLKFALTVEPQNSQLQQYQNNVAEKRRDLQPTLPTQLATQLAINPFLRCDQPSVKHTVSAQANKALANEVAVFTQLRQWKDRF